MTVLSCLAIGVAFVLAVALLLLAGFLLGWCVPGIFDRARRPESMAPGARPSEERASKGGPSEPSP
jgi:hypothetical protein